MPVDDRYYAEVGRRIRDARDRSGMTQEALSSMVGLSRTSVTNIERGRQKLLLHTLRDIAAALGVAVAQLLPDQSSAGPQPELEELLKGRPVSERMWIESALRSQSP